MCCVIGMGGRWRGLRMGSRRARGLFEVLLDVAARLHWSVSVILAVAIYLALTWVSRDFYLQPGPVAMPEMGHFVIHRFVVSAALFLRWIIPAGLLIGAGVSVWKGRGRRRR